MDAGSRLKRIAVTVEAVFKLPDPAFRVVPREHFDRLIKRRAGKRAVHHKPTERMVQRVNLPALLNAQLQNNLREQVQRIFYRTRRFNLPFPHGPHRGSRLEQIQAVERNQAAPAFRARPMARPPNPLNRGRSAGGRSRENDLIGAADVDAKLKR